MAAEENGSVKLQFETSASTDQLDLALAAAQGAFDAAPKDRENPHFRSKYADLASVWGACRSALHKNKVSVTQWVLELNGAARVKILTRLAHQGQWMQATASIPVSADKSGNITAQAVGSAITYLRRYSLAAALGVVADDDDDGNHASAPALVPMAPVLRRVPVESQTPVPVEQFPDSQKPISRTALKFGQHKDTPFFQKPISFWVSYLATCQMKAKAAGPEVPAELTETIAILQGMLAENGAGVAK